MVKNHLTEAQAEVVSVVRKLELSEQLAVVLTVALAIAKILGLGSDDVKKQIDVWYCFTPDSSPETKH